MSYLDSLAGSELICPICGKLFIRPAENIYKMTVEEKLVHYCSYTCFRVVQKEREAKIAEARRAKKRAKRREP